MHITFILVRPAVPENIGAAARALVTCGFDDLVLVNPEGHRDEKARWLAVGAGQVLDAARVMSGLAEAIKGADLVIGTTARQRHFPRPVLDCGALPAFLEQKGDPALRVALVFGSEESGLTNEELALCQIVSTVAIAAPYPSLNLAQAVMVYAYELSRRRLVAGTDGTPAGDCPPDAVLADPDKAPPVSPATLGVFLDQTRRVLFTAGIKPEENAYRRILEDVARFNAWEIGVFHLLWKRLLSVSRPDEDT